MCMTGADIKVASGEFPTTLDVKRCPVQQRLKGREG